MGSPFAEGSERSSGGGPKAPSSVARGPSAPFPPGPPSTDAGVDEVVWMMPLAILRPGQPVVRLIFSTSSSSTTSHASSLGAGEGVCSPTFINISSSEDGESLDERSSFGDHECAGGPAKVVTKEAQPIMALGAAPKDD